MEANIKSIYLMFHLINSLFYLHLLCEQGQHKTEGNAISSKNGCLKSNYATYFHILYTFVDLMYFMLSESLFAFFSPSRSDHFDYDKLAGK